MFTMFQGNDSKISMMRVTTFMVAIVILGIFLAHNIISMINGGGFVNLGYEEAGLLAATLGAKALQTKVEGGTPTNGVTKVPTTNQIPTGNKE